MRWISDLSDGELTVAQTFLCHHIVTRLSSLLVRLIRRLFLMQALWLMRGCIVRCVRLSWAHEFPETYVLMPSGTADVVLFLLPSHSAKVTLTGFVPLKWRQVLWDAFVLMMSDVCFWGNIFLTLSDICFWGNVVGTDITACWSQLFGTWVHSWRRVLALWRCHQNQKPRLDFSFRCLILLRLA